MSLSLIYFIFRNNNILFFVISCDIITWLLRLAHPNFVVLMARLFCFSFSFLIHIFMGIQATVDTGLQALHMLSIRCFVQVHAFIIFNNFSINSHFYFSSSAAPSCLGLTSNPRGPMSPSTWGSSHRWTSSTLLATTWWSDLSIPAS